MKKRLAYTVLIIGVVLSACRNPLPPDLIPPGSPPSGDGVYVTNEGNFQFGNAEISYYNYNDTLVSPAVFANTNNRPLGDICQTMVIHNGLAYLVLNNSGKIEVVDAGTFKSTGTITALTSPRYILPVNQNKAYVSDLYADKISVIDLAGQSIAGEIRLSGWTEEMALVFGFAYVTNRESNYIYIIDASADSLVDSIDVGYGSNSIREDRDGKLWVLSSGDAANGIKAALTRVNPVSRQKELVLQFPNINSDPWRLRINGTLDTLYYLDNGIHRISINSSNLPSSPFVKQGTRNFYGLGVDPLTSEIYVSDAIDYVQRGIIYRLSPSGSEIHSFMAGIIPGDFCFR